jgi:hypothetical protein
MTEPPKKEPHSGQADGALQDSLPQSRTNFKAADDPTQAADKTLKYRLLWLAPMPAAAKLVAMAMASRSDPDGTSITVSYNTLGVMCGISPQQVLKHVRTLRNLKVLVQVHKASQHNSAAHRLDLAVLKKLALEAAKEDSDPYKTICLDRIRPIQKGRPDSRKRLQTYLLRSPDLSKSITYPLHPSGEKEAGAGPGFASPPGIGEEVWTELMAARPDLKPGEMYRSAQVMFDQKCSAAEIEEQMRFLIAADARKFTKLQDYKKPGSTRRDPARGPVDYAEGF